MPKGVSAVDMVCFLHPQLRSPCAAPSEDVVADKGTVPVLTMTDLAVRDRPRRYVQLRLGVG